jgi:hypothetical protein
VRDRLCVVLVFLWDIPGGSGGLQVLDVAVQESFELTNLIIGEFQPDRYQAIYLAIAVRKSAMVTPSRKDCRVCACSHALGAIVPSTGETSGAGNIVSFVRLLGLGSTELADAMRFAGDALDILCQAGIAVVCNRR